MLASERLRAFVEAADRASTDIKSAADTRLKGNKATRTRIDAERLAAEVCDALVARSEALARDAQSLVALLERASKRLGTDTPAPAAAGPPQKADARPGGTQGRQEERKPSPSPRLGRFKGRPLVAKPPASDSASDSSAGLRLLASQMAVAGSTREEIERRLRDEFGVTDVSPVLADVFPGSEKGTQ